MSTKIASRSPVPSNPQSLPAQESLDQVQHISHHRQRAAFAWTIALLGFRDHGNSPASHEALTAAIASNPHIAAYLLGPKNLPRVISDRFSSGAENEAIYYVAENLGVWQATPGALIWLADQLNAWSM